MTERDELIEALRTEVVLKEEQRARVEDIANKAIAEAQKASDLLKAERAMYEKASAERDTFRQELEHISLNLCGTKIEGDVTHDMVYAFVEGEIDNQSDLKDKAQASIKAIREAIERIVVTTGEDKGVILLSDDSPTRFHEKLQAHVFQHENFSPLGDALIKLHTLTD